MLHRTPGNIVLAMLLTDPGFLLFCESTIINNGTVRLVNGNDRCSGTVEVHLSGQWGTVCDDDWDTNDASVVCRMLGCEGVKEAPGSARFGSGEGTIWLDNMQCSGSETSLLDCQHGGLGTHNCNHGEDAGVICYDIPSNVTVSVNLPGEIMEGSSVTLICISEANPPVYNYTWLQTKGGIISEIATQQNYTMNHVTLEDSGHYFCVAQNTLGNRNSSGLFVDVQYPPKHTVVTINSPGAIVEGDSVSLTCNSNANPPVHNYTWYKISESGPIQMERRLMFNSVGLRDSGQYYCLVRNKHGEHRSCPVALIVLAKSKMALALGLLVVVMALQTFALVCYVKRRTMGIRDKMGLTRGDKRYSLTETQATDSLYYTPGS
ncbi:B-cell receptor CD22-like [Scleropages formosus]|uniref:B-cell receptor CD22-like n=1 Tax=Scleropages formosus TaxID=113540 RepID=UPI000878B9F4|nr:B-cell receptor CD22-like [Scleropages formosus]